MAVVGTGQITMVKSQDGLTARLIVTEVGLASWSVFHVQSWLAVYSVVVFRAVVTVTTLTIAPAGACDWASDRAALIAAFRSAPMPLASTEPSC